MVSDNPPVASQVRKFRDQYLQLLEKQGIKAAAKRWYVVRAKQYIKSRPDLKLTAHGPEEVETLLQVICRNFRLQDWQCEQTVDAIQKLFLQNKKWGQTTVFIVC